MPFGGGTTSFVYPGLPQGTWNFGIQAQFSCGAVRRRRRVACSPSTASSLRMQPRAPDPADNADLSYAPGIIRGIAAAYPGDLANSCLEHGGNNRWLFRVVRALRERDKRWGLNWKRANVGDMSQDVITYNWGHGSRRGHLQAARVGHHRRPLRIAAGLRSSRRSPARCRPTTASAPGGR